MPLKATSTSGNAKTRSSSEGVPAIAPGSVSTSGSKIRNSPKATTSSCSSRSASTISAARSNRRGVLPRALTTATPTITAAASRNSGAPRSKGSKNTAA